MIKQLILLGSLFFSMACTHVQVKPIKDFLGQEKTLLKRNFNLVLVPENKKNPSYILFQQKDRYVFGNNSNTASHKLEASIDPLMRNFFMVAKVEKNGKVVREYIAKKNATSVLSDKKTSWTP